MFAGLVSTIAKISENQEHDETGLEFGGNSTYFAAKQPCRRVLYATNAHVLHRYVFDNQPITLDLRLVGHFGVLDEDSIDLLRRANAFECSEDVTFVGDFDPLDIFAFLSLRLACKQMILRGKSCRRL